MKLTVAAVGVVSALALSGCSSSGSGAAGDNAAGSGSPSAVAGTDVCDTLTAAINAAAHASWHAPTETDNGTLHNCVFGPSDPGVLTLQIANGESHAGFADNKQIVAAAGSVQSLSGIGDEAYTQTRGGAVLVASRQGDVGVVVQLQDGNKDTATAIARAALSVVAK